MFHQNLLIMIRFPSNMLIDGLKPTNANNYFKYKYSYMRYISINLNRDQSVSEIVYTWSVDYMHSPSGIYTALVGGVINCHSFQHNLSVPIEETRPCTNKTIIGSFIFIDISSLNNSKVPFVEISYRSDNCKYQFQNVSKKKKYFFQGLFLKTILSLLVIILILLLLHLMEIQKPHFTCYP